MIQDEIIKKILKSKKYRDIYQRTIERIVDDAIKRYGEKRAEKEAKELLHQIWGAFYKSRPDFDKLLSKFTGLMEDKENDFDYSDSKVIDDLLRLHSSTVERRKFIDEFYERIFQITGIPQAIQDIGCGFTGLGIKHMNLPKDTEYIGYDIDLAEIDFLNKISKVVFPDYSLKFKPGDVLADEFEYSDVILLLKAIPILERQKKGATEIVLDKLKCKFLVVSFPLKSLSGREVGMAKFYSVGFENILRDRNLHFEKLEFENEMVYIVKIDC